MAPAWLAVVALLARVAPGAAAVAAADTKIPVVKWGQKSDRLYLHMPLPDIEDPQVQIDEDHVFFSAHSRGQDYEVTLPLLRGINVSDSKHTINQWSVNFELKKLKQEPCWKRLLKEKTTYTWLKKDHDRMYAQDCQHAKELWRDAYFTAKLEGRSPNQEPEEEEVEGESSGAPKKNPKDDFDEKKKKEREAFEAKVNEFRKKAVPRTKKEKKKKSQRRASKKKTAEL